MDQKLINKYIDLFSKTYGPTSIVCGRLDLNNANYITTRDGRTILDWVKQMEVSDEEVMLQALLSIVSKKIEQIIGDGTTTAILILLYFLKHKPEYGSFRSFPDIKEDSTFCTESAVVSLLKTVTHIAELHTAITNHHFLFVEALRQNKDVLFVQSTEDAMMKGIFLASVQLSNVRQNTYKVFTYTSTLDDYGEASKISQYLEANIPCMVIAPNINYNIEQQFLTSKGKNLFYFVKYDMIGDQKIRNAVALSKIKSAIVVQTDRGLMFRQDGVVTHYVCCVNTSINNFEFQSNANDLETFYKYASNNKIYSKDATKIYPNLVKVNMEVCKEMQKLAHPNATDVCINTIYEAMSIAISVYEMWCLSKTVIIYKQNTKLNIQTNG